MYTYCDDSYILAPSEYMASTLHRAPGIFAKVRLRLGYGPSKTELILPRGCSRQEFPFPMDDSEVPSPHMSLRDLRHACESPCISTTTRASSITLCKQWVPTTTGCWT